MNDPVFLILPGVTADQGKRIACKKIVEGFWPEARVLVPDYLSRFRGVRGTGHWVDRWLERNVSQGTEIFVLAYILGGAALAYAPHLVSRAKGVVLVRSRYQENVPRYFTKKYGFWGTTFVLGKAVADLGSRSYWPEGFRLDCPLKVLMEAWPSYLAEKLGLEPIPIKTIGMKIDMEIEASHDDAYHSKRLVKPAVEFLKSLRT